MSRLPAVRPRELVAALERAGFVRHHQKGSHLYLWHPEQRGMTAVPVHSGYVYRGQIRSTPSHTDTTEAEYFDLTADDF